MLKKYLVFDIGGTFVKWAIIDSNYNIIENSKWSYDGKNEGKDLLVKDLSSKIQEVEKNMKIDGIGISTAGVVAPISQKIMGENFNIKNMENTDFRHELKAATNTFICVENDANAAIMGESTTTDLQSFKNILMITLGTGIGGGIIINGKIYQGTKGIAGEIGHHLYNGERWEYYYSTIGLLRLVKEKTNLDLSTYEILESKDPQIVSILDSWYEGIAHVLANVTILMNFDAIIIGGGISESKLFDLDLIRKKMIEFMPLEPFHDSFKLFKASLGNSAAIIGMAKVLNEKIK